MRIYFGIPIYGGADALFISSLMKTRIVLDKLGHEVEVDYQSGCSLITKARNEIVKRFMDSGFDVLVFLDSDLTWDVIDLVQLITTEHEFAACVYRAKSDKEKFHCVTNEEGKWIKADSVATGFMSLRRSVFEKMRVAYPETEYEFENETYHALFDTEVFERKYWGEDYTFCRRWRAIGGEINVLTDATLGHIGSKTYEGNFSAYQKEKINVSVAV